MKQNRISTSMSQLVSHLFRAVMLVALFASLQGCKDPDIITEPGVLQTDEKDTQLQALSRYLADATGAPIEKVKYDEEQKAFMIDGDMQVSRASAEEYLNADKSGRTSQKRGFWLLSDNVAKDVKIFISPSVTPEWKEAIRKSIFEWNFLPNMKVNFREVLVNYNTDVVITTTFSAPVPAGTQTWIAQQNMPDMDGTTGGGMVINSYYNPNARLSKEEKQYAIAHELGHVIGFAHTDKPTAGLIDFQVCNTPVFDDASVMKFVVRGWNGFSYYDYIASTVLYPENDWTALPGLATDVAAASGPDRALWSISKIPVNGGFAIQQFNYVTKTFNTVSGGALRIAVGPDGTPWVVNNLGQIFKRVNSQWKQVPGSALDISVGATGSVYIISTTPAPGGYAIKFLENGQWKQLPGIGAMRITVTSGGIPWAIDNANRVLQYSSKGMVDSGQTGRDIAAGKNGSLYLIGTTPVPGGYSVKENEKGCWVQLSGGGVAITAHGYGLAPVIINNLGLVFEN